MSQISFFRDNCDVSSAVSFFFFLSVSINRAKTELSLSFYDIFCSIRHEFLSPLLLLSLLPRLTSETFPVSLESLGEKVEEEVQKEEEKDQCRWNERRKDNKEHKSPLCQDKREKQNKKSQKFPKSFGSSQTKKKKIIIISFGFLISNYSSEQINTLPGNVFQNFRRQKQ